MKNYNNFLVKCINKKYKGITIFDKKFHKLFFSQRKINLIYLKKKRILSDKVKDKDTTYKKLKEFYNSKSNKNIEKKIIIFYKKFEANLSLKIAYNKNFKKISNLETSVCTYVFLGLLVYRSKFLNKFQKINCILKILDKILIKKKNINSCNNCSLSLLMTYEKKIVLSLIYEK